MEKENDFYKLLGVPREIDAAGLKSSFRRLVKQYHPDKTAGDSIATEKFRKITEEYRVLIDPLQRESYDLQSSDALFKEEAVAYLHVSINKRSVRLNEEVELTYSYAGEGRFFQRSEMDDWVITSGPLVDHRFAEHDGRLVKETVLNYTVCPIRTGTVIIPPASIKIRRQQFFTESLSVDVKENHCYYKDGAVAGSHPYVVYLHKERTTSTTIYRKTIVHRRRILIPRSDIAYWYHRVGRIIRICWIFCVTAWTLAHGFGIIAGVVAGAIAGGINCRIMYWLMRIRPVHYYSLFHPKVNEYISEGYDYGKEPSYGFFGKRWWKMVRSLFY